MIGINRRDRYRNESVSAFTKETYFVKTSLMQATGPQN